MQDIDKYIGKIHHADCLEFMKQLPDKCIDLVLTDPPYGMNFQSGYRQQKHRKIENDNNIDWFPICIEKDKDYYEASVKRLEDHKKQLTLF